MPKGFVWIAVGLMGAAPALGQSIDDRLKDGYARLKSGATEEALAAFRDARIDAPESDVVDYSIAHGQYERGLAELQSKAVPAAMEDLEAARSAFRELQTSADPFVRQQAGFNAANCAAQMAKASMDSGEHEKTVQLFRDAIKSYEQVLDQNPNHQAARKNLNHMRYLLKKMLQDPPPQQQQPQQGEGDENSEGEEKQQQEQGEGDQSEEQQPGEKGESQGSNQQQQQQGGSNDEDAQQASGGPEKSGEEPREQNRHNIEAILQSLEDQDREEQKKLRKAGEPPRIRNGKWW